MSQIIHHAQAVQRILGDASLPSDERLRKAMQAFSEIELDKCDQRVRDEHQAAFRQMRESLDDSGRRLDESKAMLDERLADIGQIRALLDQSAPPPDGSEVVLDPERLDRCRTVLASIGSWEPSLREELGPVAAHDPRLLEALELVALREPRLVESLQSVASHDLQLFEALDAAAARIVEIELDRIVAELDEAGRVLPESAICEAREHRDLMVPRLIQVLREAIAAARAGGVPEGQAHFFAVFLLTEFQAEAAFPVMLEAFTLAGDLPFDLFGDAVHEVVKRMLALFSGDRPDAIEALVDDRAVNMYVRWQAASSFLYMVGQGRIDRDEAVRRLQRSLRRAIDGDDGEMAGPLVCELADYAPAEALADIREAFERNLVDELLVDLESVERDIAERPSRLREVLGRRRPATIDTLEELKTWAAFRPDRPARRTGTLAPRPPLESIFPAPHFQADDEPHSEKREPIVASGPRIGRNDPCPCGSGKKFKKCCGAKA